MIITAIRIAKLLVKKYRNELTDQERMELESWRAAHPTNAPFEENLMTNSVDEQELAWLDAIDTETAWRKTQERRPKKRRLVYWSAAAAVLLIAGSAYLFLNQKDTKISSEKIEYTTIIKQDVNPALLGAKIILANGEQRQVDAKLSLSDSSGVLESGSSNTEEASRPKVSMLNTLVVPMANHFQLTLADGTSVWVNANSELKFPTKFDGNERKVYLQGEAYFEVAKDANRPFYVVTQNGTVKVLGTHFNVSTYGNSSKTTLAEGSVEVSKNEHSEIIKPGQKAEVRGNEIQVKKANLQKDLAWKNNEFYFKKDNIVDIATQLKMWYNLDVSFASDVSLTETYSGEIKRDSRLSEVIKMLEFVSDLKFTLDKNKLLITKK
ncbi:DUF4974 domain-containing protein [Sphingobacterium sp. DK4209]|uniref:DUF4974 domain-containing protein n=1 Tax=Sphingobacterium zhuxiongii TaxID=2662364 RepID=A0A5Q0Q4M1_9SPHI|nr:MULTISPECIES: FecR family protein [unclassified Sphingobacterium]MVZ66243.1 DUF4974 domain-containing protein [Sphingobacterium sp. DK4209]QGA24967.1 DUF4974 domain-containing protein [Sphingobacterium sp. dk4302]